MTGRYVVRPAALRDVDDIATHIARDNVAAGLRFYDAIQVAFQQLAAIPGMGRRREYPEPEFADIRSYPVRQFRNYLVFYRPSPGGIEAIRVLHGARDVDRLVRQE